MLCEAENFASAFFIARRIQRMRVIIASLSRRTCNVDEAGGRVDLHATLEDGPDQRRPGLDRRLVDDERCGHPGHDRDQPPDQESAHAFRPERSRAGKRPSRFLR